MMLLAILIPFSAAALLFLCAGRARLLLGLGSGIATLIAVAGLAWRVWQNGAQKHFVGGWSAPLGINLYADGLSVMMLLLTALAGVFVSLYSLAWFADGKPETNSPVGPDNRHSHGRAGWRERDLFWPLWMFLWAALNALFLSADLFNLYVVLELVTLAAVALATLSGKLDAVRAGLRYLIAALTASMAYLIGVALTYGAFDTLDLHLLAQRIQPGDTAALALTLMTIGLLLKTALFPLHFWLPPAHSAAGAPVSAVLSGLVVKGSFYLLLRLWFQVFEQSKTIAAGQMIGALGAAAILWGSFQAIRQQRLKLLVAHSTVGQIGYLFLIFPLLAGRGPGQEIPWLMESWSGGVYQAVSHGLAKAAMFLAAGVIIFAMGNDEMQGMRDIAGRLPIATFALGLAGMSLIGLPPSGGFVAKWMLIKAIIASGQWWWLPVIVIGGLLTAGYVFLMLRHAFVPAGREIPLRPVPMSMQVSALVLALLAVVIGFRLEEPLYLLRIGTLIAQPTLEGIPP